MASEKKPRKATKREQLIYTAAGFCARSRDFVLTGTGEILTGLTIANRLSKEFKLGVTFSPPKKMTKRTKAAGRRPDLAHGKEGGRGE